MDNEILAFSKILANRDYLKTIDSTTSFWIDNSNSLPYLEKLAVVINNIPSSSSYIERYFSECEFICSSRRARMKDDIIEAKCLLKTNINLLTLLSEVTEI